MYVVVELNNKMKKDESRELKQNISFNIRKYRKIRHLTQEELAEDADISYDFMRRIESSKGSCGFSVFTLYKLAVALDVSIDELMNRNLSNLTKTNIE